MKKLILAVAATVALAAPAQAYTCKSAMDLLITDLEEAMDIMDKTNLAAPTASDMKRLNEAAAVMGRNDEASRWLNDPANKCREDAAVMGVSERAKALSRRIADFYREVMSDPKMMMLFMQSGSAK